MLLQTTNNNQNNQNMISFNTLPPANLTAIHSPRVVTKKPKVQTSPREAGTFNMNIKSSKAFPINEVAIMNEMVIRATKLKQIQEMMRVRVPDKNDEEEEGGSQQDSRQKKKEKHVQ